MEKQRETYRNILRNKHTNRKRNKEKSTNIYRKKQTDTQRDKGVRIWIKNRSQKNLHRSVCGTPSFPKEKGTAAACFFVSCPEGAVARYLSPCAAAAAAPTRVGKTEPSWEPRRREARVLLTKSREGTTLPRKTVRVEGL